MFLKLYAKFCSLESKYNNNSEWAILAILQLFQYFPTKVIQIDSEWPVLPILQLFQYFPIEVIQIDSEWPILDILQLF